MENQTDHTHVARARSLKTANSVQKIKGQLWADGD